MKVRFFYPSILILALISLISCSGYHFNTNNNPLIGYDIKTVAVPMFINRSVLPQLTAPMTKEIILALNDYTGLKVISGDSENSDAVLIGILESRNHYNEVVETSQSLFTEDEIATSIGSRSPFYYPVQTRYNFSLRIICVIQFIKSYTTLNGKSAYFTTFNFRLYVINENPVCVAGTYVHGAGEKGYPGFDC